jgi:mono/diheme cytochrome c family protein
MAPLGLLLLAAFAHGCSTSKPPPDEVEPKVIDPLIEPKNSYSGFDGQHTFRFPISVYRASADLSVTVSNPKIAKVEAVTAPADVSAGDEGKFFMVTVLAAGSTEIVAVSQGVTRKATVTATAYDPARFADGERRYKNGGAGEKACSDCHQRSGGPDHSPSAISNLTDQGVTSIITTGAKGTDRLIPDHMWSPTPSELQGLISYLRALEPRGYVLR